jgi:hypothetical protein
MVSTRGKSESASQLVNEDTWRTYPIRRFYWDSRTCSKREAERKADELRRLEEREAQDAGETSTDADRPIIGRQRPSATPPMEAGMLKPPSAPKPTVSSVRRKDLPKPLPSAFMLEKRKKRSATPRTSEDEEQDPFWSRPSKKVF